MHKFNPSEHKKLHSAERYRLMPPDVFVSEILKETGNISVNEEAIVIADVGCGSGFFSIPLIKKLQDENILFFGLDISAEMLGIFGRNLKSEINGSNLSKIKTLQSEEAFLPLGDHSVDILMMTNVFHEIEDKKSFLKEVKRVLKKNGVMFILDWSRSEENPVMGPPVSERVSESETVEALKDMNFEGIRTLPLYSSSFVIRAAN